MPARGCNPQNYTCTSFPKARSIRFENVAFKNSRYKDGTTKTGSLVFSHVPYRALRSDRCLVITTCSSRLAPFHGADAGSNPAGDANFQIFATKVARLRLRNISNALWRKPLRRH